MKSAIVVSLCAVVAAAQVSYSPCPLIGNYFPAPSRASILGAKLPAAFGTAFSDLVQHSGHPVYGPISANTTSFSVIYFSGDADNKSQGSSPVLFEYHHTSAYDAARNVSAVTADTKFPLAEVTMVMTVYAWLATMGDRWDEPITKYFSELDAGHNGDLGIPWSDITVGTLAGHMSGLPRLYTNVTAAKICTIGAACEAKELFGGLDAQGPTFLPDSSPIVSYAAFQVLALAIERSNKIANRSFASIMKERVLAPLSMNSTSFLDKNSCSVRGLTMTKHGEQAALSLVSSTHDLALAGRAMLSATLASPAATRRWLHRSTDTSNLRNGAGLPWEVYRVGSEPISPVVDALTKTGTLGPPSGGSVVLGLTDASSPGLEIKSWTAGDGGNQNVKEMVAVAAGIASSSLDYRLYPTNVRNSTRQQFVAVLQDKSAPVDAGTPTCITWQDVGALEDVPYRFLIEMGHDGTAISVSVQNGETYARS
ncbi:hypothetical protein LLEC1_02113 [Akanthomyces lecanii]|uniref:Beta-lactamase-like ARB-00930-like C-terminal domain-containing protein n=1 Tax=Cordyceps confragosa TaxID=2714763 RepID=A0A179I1V5_CORDF|nr:hypothetical protein LLEC1_02113 [Akanthomyces lecanii]